MELDKQSQSNVKRLSFRWSGKEMPCKRQQKIEMKSYFGFDTFNSVFFLWEDCIRLLSERECIQMIELLKYFLRWFLISIFIHFPSKPSFV